MPGIDWVRGFTKRHQLTQRISDNVNTARSEVNEVIINNYFNEIEPSLERILATHIFYYDMTNITIDPREKHVVRRWKKRVEQKTQHSKSVVTVIFAGSATGEFLLLMVV